MSKKKTSKPRNFVAKHMNTFNRSAVHRDKTKYSRKGKNRNIDCGFSLTAV